MSHPKRQRVEVPQPEDPRITKLRPVPDAFVKSTRSNRFHHAPIDLQQASLRLIEVLPSESESPNRLIECSIRHETINTAYTCLSYVWGPDTDEGMRTILLNGQEFSVRPNLWEFLDTASRQSARDRNVGIEKNDRTRFDFTSATQCLWIDALCIDQENVGERNHQVQQMGAIYTKAERVIAWFGKDDSIRNGFQIANGPARRNLAGPFSWNFLTLLSLHVYWQRAWVTQETTLAKELFFLADDEAVSFQTIVNLGGLATDEQDWRRVQYKPLYDVHGRSETRTLVENVLHFQDKLCLDPRDRVFSLLSISSDGDQFKVDYEISQFGLAKALCAKLDRICFCNTTTMRLIFRSQGYSYYGYVRDRQSELPCFAFRLTPLVKVNGRCDICSNVFNANNLQREREYNWDAARSYCVQCCHRRRCPELHIVIAQELNAHEASPWHTYAMEPRGCYQS